MRYRLQKASERLSHPFPVPQPIPAAPAGEGGGGKGHYTHTHAMYSDNANDCMRNAYTHVLINAMYVTLVGLPPQKCLALFH